MVRAILRKLFPRIRLNLDLIPLEPVTTLGDYKTIRQAYKLPKVKKNEVEKVLSNLQLNYATAEVVDRPAEKGDLVAVKISATLD